MAPAAGCYLVFLFVNFGPRGTFGAPAVGYCLVFLFVNPRPRGTLGLQLTGIVSVNFGPRRTLGLQLSGIVWSMSGLSVYQFRASRDSGAQAVWFCLVFLSVNFEP